MFTSPVCVEYVHCVFPSYQDEICGEDIEAVAGYCESAVFYVRQP